MVIDEESRDFIDKVRDAMACYFGGDSRRIAHACVVASHARELLAYVDANPVLTMTVAYLHDIGIHEAERRHHSNAGNFQELEGPPIARQLLEQLGATPDLIESVALIISRHHTPSGVDSAEFRILWDADALVNFAELFAARVPPDVERILSRHMVTEPGYRLACRRFLPAR